MEELTLKARAHLPPDGIDIYSGIESVQYLDGVLTVKVACSLDQHNNVLGLALSFPEVHGFRVLDELDLQRYWLSADFPRDSHLLEVTEGGWATEENELQGFEKDRREWLVVTGNDCVSIFCPQEPEIQRLSWTLRL